MKRNLLIIIVLLFAVGSIVINYQSRYSLIFDPFGNYDVNYFSHKNDSKNSVILFSIPSSTGDAAEFYSSGAIHNSVQKIPPEKSKAILFRSEIYILNNDAVYVCSFDLNGKPLFSLKELDKENCFEILNYLRYRATVSLGITLLCFTFLLYLYFYIYKEKLSIKRAYWVRNGVRTLSFIFNYIISNHSSGSPETKPSIHRSMLI